MPTHLLLTIGALIISLLITIPLASLCIYNKKLASIIISFANLVQAIPSFAVLAIVVPFFGIGFTPALFAIVLRTLLPIIKNTYVGLSTIDESTIQYAEGVGLTQFQILRYIRFPNAYPAIFSGIKFAAILANSIAILTAMIGSGGFGTNVFKYIHQYNIPNLIYSIIPVIIIAILIEFLLTLLEKKLTPKPLRNKI
jgi:osmoprotectant transport system permease protein